MNYQNSTNNNFQNNYKQYIYHFGLRIDANSPKQDLMHDSPDTVYVGPSQQDMIEATSTITFCDIVRSKLCCCQAKYLTIESKS